MFYRSLTKACMWQNFRWARKETKMKTKQLFSFPPSPPILPVFLFWPRALMTAVFNFDNVEDNTTYYTHYIRWIIEPKSKQKNYLLLQLNTTKTEKRNEKTWCLPWRKNKEKNCQGIQKTYLFYLMIFPFTLK